MTRVTAMLNKAIRIGPLPYLAFCIVILGLGVVFQIRSANPVMPDGSTIFGLFARIGGFVGLFGLVPLIFAVRDDGNSANRGERQAEPRDRHADDSEKSGVVGVLRSVLEMIAERLPRRAA